MDDLPTGEVYEFGDFRLDRGGGRLLRRETSGDLTQVAIGSRALALLDALIAHAPELVTRRDIMDAVWPGTAVEESNLSVQLSALRRALDDGQTGSSAIQTVSGRGYRLTLPVTRIDPIRTSLPDSPSPMNEMPHKATITAKRPAGSRATAACLLLALAALGGWGLLRSGLLDRLGFFGTPPALSIVVLPFANLNQDPDQAYFADAITDDLTTDLSRIAGSVVIAHSTAQTYADKPVDVRRVGAELDVSYVLEGSVRRMDDQVEVNAQLIDARSGAHVWAERFQTDRRNLAEAQSEITGRLARTLDLQLIAVSARRIDHEKPTDPNAGDLLMRGWDMWYRPMSAGTHDAAMQAFERALTIDPDSADGRIGLATILISNIGTGISQQRADDATKAERLLTEAIDQNPLNSRAYEALGTLRRIQNRLDESRDALRQAVTLDRNNAHALLQLGETMIFLGRPSEAVSFIEQSVRLNPRDSNAAFSDWALGACDLLLGRNDEAVALLRRASTQNSRVYFFHLWLAGALGEQGNVGEAKVALEAARQAKPDVDSLARWDLFQPWLGNPALRALRESTLDRGLRAAGMPDH